MDYVYLILGVACAGIGGELFVRRLAGSVGCIDLWTACPVARRAIEKWRDRKTSRCGTFDDVRCLCRPYSPKPGWFFALKESNNSRFRNW